MWLISIKVRQIYQGRISLSDPLVLNQVAIQLSPQGWVDPVTYLNHI